MKTRTILTGLILLAGIVILSGACTKKDNNPTLDFDIKVPPNWFYYILNTDDIVFYAVSPAESDKDTVTEDILITKDVATGGTLSSFYTAFMASNADDSTFKAVQYSGDTTINGSNARKLINLQTLYSVNSTTHDTLKFHAKMTRYFFVHNSYEYLVSMSALVTSYAKYKPIYDTVISSFKFKN